MTTVVAEDKGGLLTISGRQWLILLMVQLANMLFGMTITLANLVLPQMRGNLSATQEEISWVHHAQPGRDRHFHADDGLAVEPAGLAQPDVLYGAGLHRHLAAVR